MLQQAALVRRCSELARTYDCLVKLEAVGLVKNRVVEIIQSRFRLQCELVEHVEAVEGEHSPRAIKSGREPTGTQ